MIESFGYERETESEDSSPRLKQGIRNDTKGKRESLGSCHSEGEKRRGIYEEGVKMYYVYMMTNWCNRVLYTGGTNDLERRLCEHRVKINKGYTEKYNINRLVYYEDTGDIEAAIEREKQIKSWRREKENKLIESMNPGWKDLSENWDK
jgi:putative endonuclease